MLSTHLGFPGWRSDKESACQFRRHGFSPWVGKIPWRRKWQTTCILAWRIPWAEESGRPQSLRLHRARHNLATKQEQHLLCACRYCCGQQKQNSPPSWSLFAVGGTAAAAAAKSLQSCPTLGDPIDGSPPGSSVPGGVCCHFLLQCMQAC